MGLFKVEEHWVLIHLRADGSRWLQNIGSGGLFGMSSKAALIGGDFP